MTFARVIGRTAPFSRAACASIAAFVAAAPAAALPFNQDMVGRQYIHGRLVRNLPDGVVPRGGESRYVKDKAAALALSNPVAPDRRSLAHGERLYNANCTSCHGKFIDGKYVPGPTPVTQWMPGVNLGAPYMKAKPDGHFFQFIHFGGMAIMPAYGYKFSFEEHWDIVNYLRSIQNGPALVDVTASPPAGAASAATPPPAQ